MRDTLRSRKSLLGGGSGQLIVNRIAESRRFKAGLGRASKEPCDGSGQILTNRNIEV